MKNCINSINFAIGKIMAAISVLFLFVVLTNEFIAIYNNYKI